MEDKPKYLEFYGSFMLLIAAILFMIGLNDFIHTIELKKLLFSTGAMGLILGMYLYRQYVNVVAPIHIKVRSFFLLVISSVLGFAMIGYTGNARIIKSKTVLRDIRIDTIIPISVEYYNIDKYEGPPDFVQVKYHFKGNIEEIRIYPKDFKCFDPNNMELTEKVGILGFKTISYLPPKDCDD